MENYHICGYSGHTSRHVYYYRTAKTLTSTLPSTEVVAVCTVVVLTVLKAHHILSGTGLSGQGHFLFCALELPQLMNSPIMKNPASHAPCAHILSNQSGIYNWEASNQGDFLKESHILKISDPLELFSYLIIECRIKWFFNWNHRTNSMNIIYHCAA